MNRRLAARLLNTKIAYFMAMLIVQIQKKNHFLFLKLSYIPFFSVVMYVLPVSSLNVIISIAQSIIVFVSEPERLDNIELFVAVES